MYKIGCDTRWTLVLTHHQILTLLSYSTVMLYMYSITAVVPLEPTVDLFLESMGLSQYLQRMLDEGFDDWNTFLDMTENDMVIMGFEASHRNKLRRVIKKQQRQGQALRRLRLRVGNRRELGCPTILGRFQCC